MRNRLAWRRFRTAGMLAGMLAFPAVGHARVDVIGPAATTPPPRQLLVTLTGSGQGNWNGTNVIVSPTNGSFLPIAQSGRISYRWKSVKPLSFMIPPFKDKAFDATAQGDLTGSWQFSESGTKVDDTGSFVEPYNCNHPHEDIPTPVNAELSYQPGAGQAILTLYPDVFFFPSVQFDCWENFTTINYVADPIIMAHYLFQSPDESPDAQASLVLPSTFITVPKAATVNYPHERIDTQNGDETQHLVNDGTVHVNPCGGYGNGIVTFVQGDASAGGEALGLGSAVSDGSTVTTKGRTRIEIRLPDKSVLRIGPQSKVDLTCAVFGKSAEDRKVNAKLVVGDIWAKVAHAIGGDAKFEVQTENAVNGVRGTIFTVNYRGGTTVVHAIQDTVWTRGIRSGKTTVVKAPMCAKVVGGHAPTSPYHC